MTESVMGSRTTLIVAHRLSNIQRADRILVLHNGEVREQGNHEELLALKGFYWRLHRLQHPVRDLLPEQVNSIIPPVLLPDRSQLIS